MLPHKDFCLGVFLIDHARDIDYVGNVLAIEAFISDLLSVGMTRGKLLG